MDESLPPAGAHFMKPLHLVFMGGGHSNALVLLDFARNPLPGIQLTLISESRWAPYSGLLPGHIAGFYTRESIHIDLLKTCRNAGARFVEQSITSFSPDDETVECADGSRFKADLFAINTGAIPNLSTCPGAMTRVIPSKPVPRLLAGWDLLKQTAWESQHPLQIVVVGGGAGGVELCLNMKRQLPASTSMVLIHSGESILTGHNVAVRRLLQGILKNNGIQIITGERVISVSENSLQCSSGRTIPHHRVFWATQAEPPGWVRRSGLATNSDGFIRVSPTLQSLSHPQVFAAGDVASLEHAPRPKSGVFAVRMARPLAANLRAWIQQQPLSDYHPQRHFLNLIGTGDGRAVASWRNLAFHSRLCWIWKDRIDRRFMNQF